MVHVAMISDLHLDSNHQDAHTVARQQAVYLQQQQVGVYLIAGDITNHFSRSLAFTQDLQRQLAPARVKFVAGNHDMVHDISYAGLESPQGPTYLHRGYLDVPGTNWRIIGNNGWYDYLFADNLTDRNFLTWKRAFWVDAAITQPMTDPERMDEVLAQVEEQLWAAQQAGKRVLFITHFVPRRDYIKITDDDRFWNMANALLGSPRLGDLLTKYHVAITQFGHVHRHFAPRHLAGTTYYDQAVGYRNKRFNEWSQPDYMTEWQQRLRILDLK